MSHDDNAVCPCVAEHHPAPLELHSHHVFPLALGGPDTSANRLWLCPTTHVNVHELLRLMMTNGPLTHHECVKALPQSVSRIAHRVALDGYRQWQRARSAAV